jgi:hypothetical protein
MIEEERSSMVHSFALVTPGNRLLMRVLRFLGEECLSASARQLPIWYWFQEFIPAFLVIAPPILPIGNFGWPGSSMYRVISPAS